MGRVTRSYALALSSGERIVLEATNYHDAVSEALGRFGAKLQAEEAVRAQPSDWDEAIRDIIGSTRAHRFQVEALRGIRGIGAGTCRRLCRHAREATQANVLAILRGRTRLRAQEIIEILNARTVGDLSVALQKPAPHSAKSMAVPTSQ